MAIGRDDRDVADAQGRALSGATVYYCTQPVTSTSIPPSPLATTYAGISGDPGTNPVLTDGFGHSIAYLDCSVPYTLVINHPLFGSNPIIRRNQVIPFVEGEIEEPVSVPIPTPVLVVIPVVYETGEEPEGTYFRDDRWVADAQGRSLAGALVYYCTQPASTGSLPPGPLATIYSDSEGSTGTNPAVADGFGHSFVYLSDAVPYTVVVWHPLFGQNPVVLPDQIITGGSSPGSFTPVQASTTAGTITGTIPGSVFTLPWIPVAGSLILQRNGQVLTPGLTYTIPTGSAVITLSYPLTAGENLNANAMA